MANALKNAPSKEETLTVAKPTKEELALSQEFDANKKYMFQLVSENPERENPVIDMRTKRPAPHQKFKPYQNIVLTSQIIWNGSRRMLRYYDGCSSIFVDEQPKEKDTIDQFIKQTKRREFLNGLFGCYGDERLLLLYLTICSWNIESEFRTRTADTVFIAQNPDKKAVAESSKLDSIELALGYAREASEKKMLIHAAYLGIEDEDYDSGNKKSMSTIRTEYRKKAIENPVDFISSYDNKSIEIKHWIKVAWLDGTITNKLNPNKATWKSGTEICDISGLKSSEVIIDKIYEFSQLDDGQEFTLQLKAIYD